MDANIIRFLRGYHDTVSFNTMCRVKFAGLNFLNENNNNNNNMPFEKLVLNPKLWNTHISQKCEYWKQTLNCFKKESNINK